MTSPRPAILSKTFSDVFGKDSSKKTVVSISPTTSIQDALALMAKHNVLTLPITSRVWPDKYVYILSSFDILQFFVSKHHGKLGGVDLESTVEAAMTLDYEAESYRVYERDFRDSLESTCIAFAQGTHRALITDALRQRPAILLTQTDILRYLLDHPEEYSNAPTNFSTTLKDLGITSRGHVHAVSESETAIEGYSRMASKKVSALPVVDKDGKVVDSLSASDLRGMSEDTLKNVMLPVREFVKISSTHKELTVSLTENNTLNDALKIMVDTNVHRVWILDAEKRPIGVISQSDVIGAVVGIPFQKIPSL